MARVRLSIVQRETRRKSRKLSKLLGHIPSHKHPLAQALIDIAVGSDLVEARRALDRLNGLLVDEPLPNQTDGRLQGITSVIRALDGENQKPTESHQVRGASHGLGPGVVLGIVPDSNSGTANTPSTPSGHANRNTNNERHIKYSPQHHPVIDERLPCKPIPWASKEELSKSIFKYYIKYKPAGLLDKFPWDKMSLKERKNWVLFAGELWSVLDASWPKDLPVRPPVVPPGFNQCPACDGTGSVPRVLKIALEWFLARRAKKAKLDGRSRIDPTDWGYEEIAAVELCAHYREKGEPMLAVTLEEGVPGLYQTQKPTRLHPNSIAISRYPTETQILRGQLDIREKHKSLSAVHASQLKKMKKSKVRGPVLTKKEDRWSAEWGGRGVGCTILHKNSGLKTSSESFTNFKQNLCAAEIALEKKVEKWFQEEAQTSDENSTSCNMLSGIGSPEASPQEGQTSTP